MVLIALIAIGLGVAGWWAEAGLGAPDWWEAYWREKPVRDAWNGPLTIRVTRQENLECVLERLKVAMIRPRLKHGPWIVVDRGALQSAGRTLRSSITAEIDAKGTSACEFFDLVLKPMGLACKLQDGMVMVTAIESLDEPLFFGDHGEVLCNHGEWVPIGNKRLSP